MSLQDQSSISDHACALNDHLDSELLVSLAWDYESLTFHCPGLKWPTVDISKALSKICFFAMPFVPLPLADDPLILDATLVDAALVALRSRFDVGDTVLLVLFLFVPAIA